MNINTKRVYDEPSPQDGYRVLVDRLWPRGLKKETVKADAWLKTIAPSTELRKWFHANSERWNEFQKRYTEELKTQTNDVSELRTRAKEGTVTLLYSVRDPERNHAVVLKQFLERE